MWLLDMFPPSPSTTIIIPYEQGDGSKPATTDYFGQMGPFYELESVSPVAFLAPGEKQVHKHAVCHFTGREDGLNRVCKGILGVGLGEANH
jgi:hypothetical protein